LVNTGEGLGASAGCVLGLEVIELLLEGLDDWGWINTCCIP